jgi:hypothetical protein
MRENIKRFCVITDDHDMMKEEIEIVRKVN